MTKKEKAKIMSDGFELDVVIDLLEGAIGIIDTVDQNLEREKLSGYRLSLLKTKERIEAACVLVLNQIIIREEAS